jgi:hypothetical protein
LYWEKLSDGGEKGQCGWLKDRFGLSWQVVPSALGHLMGDADPEKSRRVMEAMLRMNKIDIDALKKAYRGCDTPIESDLPFERLNTARRIWLHPESGPGTFEHV